jgi:hypothetical protein
MTELTTVFNDDLIHLINSNFDFHKKYYTRLLQAMDDPTISEREKKTILKVLNTIGDPFVQRLTNLPEDVLRYMATTMKPSDILSLSRTNKDMENKLMSNPSLWSAKLESDYNIKTTTTPKKKYIQEHTKVRATLLQMVKDYYNNPSLMSTVKGYGLSLLQYLSKNEVVDFVVANPDVHILIYRIVEEMISRTNFITPNKYIYYKPFLDLIDKVKLQIGEPPVK